MTITAATPVPTLPSISRSSPTFRADLDTFFLTQLPATIPPFNGNTQASFDNATDAQGSANVAQQAKTDAQTAAAAAANSSNATKWAAGTFAQGAVVWSPVNGQAYRAKAAFTSATDPSLDPTNWWSNGQLTAAIPDYLLINAGIR